MTKTDINRIRRQAVKSVKRFYNNAKEAAEAFNSVADLINGEHRLKQHQKWVAQARELI